MAKKKKAVSDATKVRQLRRELARTKRRLEAAMKRCSELFEAQVQQQVEKRFVPPPAEPVNTRYTRPFEG
jgi:serine phosphatase RsbU (regulator of sigma subunit)